MGELSRCRKLILRTSTCPMDGTMSDTQVKIVQQRLGKDDVRLKYLFSSSPWCEAPWSLEPLQMGWSAAASIEGQPDVMGMLPPSTPPSLLASWSFMVLSCYLHVPERGSNKVHTCEWSNKCGTMVSSQKIPLAQGLQNCCHKIFFQDLISHQSKIKPFLKE